MEDTTMKKTYITPSVLVVQMNVSPILTTSTLNVNGTHNGEFNGRGNDDDWDDEE